MRLGEKVLVVGAGPIGLFTAQAARLAGAVVTVCDLREKRLAVAAGLGAHRVLVPGDTWENVRAEGPFDCVFEDSGGPVLDRIIGGGGNQGLLRARGRVVIIAGRDRVDYSFNAGQGCELCLYHAGHFVADDLRQVCRLAAEGVLKAGPVIQEVVRIDAAVAVYDRLRDDPGSLLGTVFDWT